MIKKFNYVAGLIALTVIPNISSAQNSLDCPSTAYQDSLTELAVPDVVFSPVAHPGAFGGTVSCLMRRYNNNVELLFIENMSPGEYTFEDVEYFSESIVYFMRFRGENRPRNAVTICSERDNNGMLCRTDLATGLGLWVYQRFDSDEKLTNFYIRALPEGGVVDPAQWRAIQESISADPDTVVNMSLRLAVSGEKIDMVQDGETPAGAPYFSNLGQQAYDFISNSVSLESAIEVSVYWANSEGSSLTTKTFDSQTISYMLNRSYALQSLMMAGYEKSKLLEF